MAYTLRAPKNSGFDPEGSDYDMESATKAGIKPDETGHYASRDPNTGLILKGRGHETFQKTIAGEEAAGYEISKGQDGRYYSQPKKVSGGYTLRPPAEAKGDELKLAAPGFQGTKLGGLIKGGKDIIDAGAQLIQHALPDSFVKQMNSLNNTIANKTGLTTPIPEGGLDQALNQDEQAYQASRAANGREGFDAMRTLGNVAVTAPIATAGPLRLAAGKGVMDVGNIVKGAAQAGVIGGLMPVTQGNFGEEKLKQVGTSAALGGVAAPAGAAIGRAVNPQVSPEIKALMDEGITPTAGQILGGGAKRLEDLVGKNVPILGGAVNNARGRAIEDLNRAAYSRALVGTGIDAKTLPVGREGVEAVRKAVSRQYDDLLPRLIWKPDATFNQEIQKIAQMTTGLGEREQARFTREINNIMSKTTNGVMLGETYGTVTSELGKAARNYSASNSAMEREIGDAMTEVLASMKNTLTRSNPAQAKELARANENWANYVRIRAASAKLGDHSGGFSPSQLDAAIKATDKSVGKGSFASNKAMMQDLSSNAVKGLGPNHPTQGDSLLRTLATGGIVAGGYTNPLLAGAAGAVGSAPYTKLGQKLSAELLTKRPKGAKAVSNALLQISPLVGAAIGAGQ